MYIHSQPPPIESGGTYDRSSSLQPRPRPHFGKNIHPYISGIGTNFLNIQKKAPHIRGFIGEFSRDYAPPKKYSLSRENRNTHVAPLYIRVRRESPHDTEVLQLCTKTKAYQIIFQIFDFLNCVQLRKHK